MNDNDIGVSQRYGEASNALRHYSTCILNVRIIAIVQGLAVLSASGWLLKDDDIVLSLMAAIFGLFFTLLLYSLQNNYWFHYKAILYWAVNCEVGANANADIRGPWSVYNEQRKTRQKQWWWSISAVHGPFVLLLIALSSIIIYDFFLIVF